MEYGRESIERYREFNRSSVLSFEKLLCNASLNGPSEELAKRSISLIDHNSFYQTSTGVASDAKG